MAVQLEDTELPKAEADHNEIELSIKPEGVAQAQGNEQHDQMAFDTNSGNNPNMLNFTGEPPGGSTSN